MSPPLSLCVAAENVEPTISCGVNIFADQVAAAMKRATSPDTGSEREPHPIATAPRDGRFLILKEDASDKFNIARWAPEAGEWVRENDQPIKITPAYWYPIREQNDFQPRLDISTSPSEPERRAAPQRQLASDVLASGSDAPAPDTIVATKMGPTAVEAKRASARNGIAAFSIAASFVVATGVGMHFRTEVTSYVARHPVGGDLFRISRISQAVWNLENQVSPAQMSQSQRGPHVDASASQIAVLQHQAEVGGIGAQASETAPAKSATLPEPAAIDVEHSPALAAERDRAAALASELGVARRDVETKAALLSKATGEAAQLKQTAEAAAAELRQSLVQERDRVAALVRELATARRSLETEVALSRKAGEEAEQLRRAAKATTGELEQERESTELVRDPEPVQRAIGTGSTIEAGTRVDPMNPVPEQAPAKPPRTAVKNNPEGKAYGPRRDVAKARDLYARASDAGIRAAEDRSRALVDRARKPASWFGREEAD